ncbi:hypothetical protein [Streptomyces cellulosae]|uniref:hypothetical protein n=1 Tax=Streptomyces cellulosae TaxID=1968 RepID=UPI0004CA662A|nr:hypothetical protein [Streptomyces cellulosae]
MWLRQPPGDDPNLHSQNPYQQPRRPQPPGGGGRGTRAKIVAVAAATTVVVSVGATGVLILGGGKDDNADSGNTKASASASKGATASAPASDKPPGGKAERPTVRGWKVVVNPRWGTAFDVPPDWEVESSDLLLGFTDDRLDSGDPKNWGKAITAMGAPAVLKDGWCLADDNKDGLVDDTPLAAVGTRGEKGAKSTGDTALSQVELWVYGGYTQPDRKSILRDRTAKPYATKSGVKGSIAWARSRNTPREGKCATDGKAITFGFKNSVGDFVAWCLVGATGVKDELPDSTIMKILSTVRLHGDPTES